jgi:coenzyme F420-0:L-glutamate ligase / coenzyme F420-1:gamma-L-glutamate ligase
MVGEIRVIAVRGIGEVRPGEDLATTILDALARQDLPLADGDVLVVTQKIV